MNKPKALMGSLPANRLGLIKAGKHTGKWCELTADTSGGWALVIFTEDPRIPTKTTSQHSAPSIVYSDYFPSHNALHYFMRDDIPEIDWQ